jgi:hypothetical protein
MIIVAARSEFVAYAPHDPHDFTEVVRSRPHDPHDFMEAVPLAGRGRDKNREVVRILG